MNDKEFLVLQQFYNDLKDSYEKEVFDCLLSYGASLEEIIKFMKSEINICQCSYEFQCGLYDIYPSWYISEVDIILKYGWF